MKVKKLDNGLIKVVLSEKQARHVRDVIGKQYSYPTDGIGVYWALVAVLEGDTIDTNGIVSCKTSKGNIRVDLTTKQYRWVYDQLGEEEASPENGYIIDTMDRLDASW